MDFYQIKERRLRNDIIEVYPDFKVTKSQDLMIRGGEFYAVWDSDRGLWSTDEYDVQRIIDQDLFNYGVELKKKTESVINVKYLSSFSTNSWYMFRRYCKNISDNYKLLDEKITFSNTTVNKNDYISKRVSYPLEPGSIDSYNELISTLYDLEERKKIEWAIGAIISGDSKVIQKFMVFYGESGAGKSTMINIIQTLFQGYYITFDAKALGSNNNQFSIEVFKNNPLIALQHDGDLSRIEDNTRINSITSHEEMVINEKHKSAYTSKINAFLFMGTNKPVKITNSKSGIIRRLIDIKPSGRKIPINRYYALVSQIDFELGAIADHCLNVYRTLGKNYYNEYVPIEMIFQTDVFFNFVEENYYLFKEQDGITLKHAYDIYKEFCDETLIEHKLPKHNFRDELKNYFNEFHHIYRLNDKQIRNYYKGFKIEKFTTKLLEKNAKEDPPSLVMDETESLFDILAKDYPAQYATADGIPYKKWSDVTTTLKDIDTSKLHYVLLPENHIVIDFDIKDNGVKSSEKNLVAASTFPATYSEYSKSGAGIHLHYIYDGDPKKLSRVYDEDIEVKVFTGNSSLRRQLIKCNNIPVMTINSGLPLKGEKVVNFDSVKSEKKLRELIKRNLGKEIHPATKPSIDFIAHLLEEAYNSGLSYDVTDMRPEILAFANNSTNNASYCLEVVSKLKFKSEETLQTTNRKHSSDKLVFFDVEVYPNLFIVCWKFEGESNSVVRMINPSPDDISQLLTMKLIGFNNRRYDNHILYARYIGYDNNELFTLSQRLVNNSKNCTFSEAYNLSYTDIYDFSTDKKSLKKWQVELRLPHKEMELEWDQPVPEELWIKIADYCVNDVLSTESVFKHLYSEYQARLILSEISGLSPNETTQNHTARIIFGTDKDPQSKFVYTDLSTIFPGYKYEFGKSSYRGEDPSEGGYIYAEPGIWHNVGLFDVESMHPTSIELLNLYGPYTHRYSELKKTRVLIKNELFEDVKQMFNGVLSKYIVNKDLAKQLSHALKIAINIVYGMSSAKFDNIFKDKRNVDNIVAKRGSLFMIDLKNAVLEKGWDVVHIKTDSIKIVDVNEEKEKFIKDFGLKYGYKFVHEDTYEKMFLLNKTTYIAKRSNGEWHAVGDTFAHPYIFKKLFSKEPILLEDKKEIRTVKSQMYLNMNENNPETDNHIFVGKVGAFLPIKPNCGGGILQRYSDGKYHSVNDTKGFRWLEFDMVRDLNKESDVDDSYYILKLDDVVKEISEYGDFEQFIL